MVSAPNRLPALLSLVGVVLTGMIGFGLFIPVFPFLALHLGASASETTLSMGAYSLGQLAAAPLWGRLSDRIGRKPVLIIGLLGAATSYCFLAGAGSIYVLGGARLFGGLMAGNIGAAFAAAGDLADDRTRARNMGLLSAAFALGFIIGPAIGGFFVGNDPTARDFANVCYLAASFATLAAIAALFLFRETLPAQRNLDAPRVRRSALISTRLLLVQMLAITLLMVTAQAMMETTFALWAHTALHFGPHDVAYVFIFIGMITVVVQGGGAGALAKRFGERRMVLGGVALFAAGFALLPLSTSWGSLAAPLAMIAIGGGAAAPALQSLISAQTTSDDRGVIMGMNQSASALGRVIGPLVSGPIFDLFGHGSPFLAGAALLCLSLALAWLVAPKPMAAASR